MTNATILRPVTPGFPAGADTRPRSADDPADAVLASRAAAGDHQAWEHIVNRHGAYLVSLGRKYRLTPDEVADAAQETWLKAFAHISALRERDRLRSWLAAIMWRSCIKAVNGRRGNHEQLAGGFADMVGGGIRDDRVDVEREVLSAERSAVLQQAMNLLPERERELLRRSFFEDCSYDEITCRMAMPMGSIGPTRQRALRRLRKILQQQALGSVLARAA